ncbi:MAG: two-component regulator propeller domain-containing protein, partial [Candidatus Zixiibacteriota bacterium]
WSVVNISGLKNANLNSVLIDSSGNIWVGTEGSGISVYADSSWTNFEIDGPPGNIFNKIAIEESGKIWCSNWSGGGSSFDGSSWIAFQDTLYFLFHRWPWMASVSLDYEGNVWFGSWGDGLFKLDSQGNWSRYDSSNSELRPTTKPFETVVSDIVVDEAGTKWMANWEGVEGRCAVALQDTFWISYLSTDPAYRRIKSNLINSLYTEGGHLWICHRDVGLGFLDYKGTPRYKEDDTIHYYSQTDGYLSGNDVKAVSVDLRENIWVGTNSGLDRYDPYSNRFRGVEIKPLGPQVNCIAVDEMNNKWIGTINGLGVINDRDSFVYVFTTTNSKLVDDKVLFIEIDNRRGKAWIGTENGLSSYQYKVPAENLCQVYPYPNPVVVRAGEEKVTFDVPLETRVRIYTVAGDWVAEAKSGGIGKVWDLRNRAGKLVASGIYLFLLYDDQRGSCPGKIVVIRE